MALLNDEQQCHFFFHDCGHVTSVIDVEQKLNLTARV